MKTLFKAYTINSMLLVYMFYIHNYSNFYPTLYPCFPGITPLTPPFGFLTSPL